MADRFFGGTEMTAEELNKLTDFPLERCEEILRMSWWFRVRRAAGWLAVVVAVAWVILEVV